MWIFPHRRETAVTDSSNPRPPRFWLRTDVPVLAATILGLIVSCINAR